MSSFETPFVPAPEKPKRRTGLSEENLKKFVRGGAPQAGTRSENWKKPGDRLPYEAPKGKSLAEQIHEEEQRRRRKAA